MNPLIRLQVDVRPHVHEGQSVLLLRDATGLSDQVVVLPQALGPLLGLCDGTRSVGEIGTALFLQTGLTVREDLIQQVIDHLDEALLLEGDRYEQAYGEAIRAFREADFRPPVLTGTSYPEAPDELRALLDSYAQGMEADESAVPGDASGNILGIISPHIDYQRGGPVYARVWQAAAEAARQAELVIIFGTDHKSRLDSTMNLTRQSYATPFGVLPTAVDVVDALAEVLGEEDAFAEEMNHRGEHSIELAAVWLHHVRGGEPCHIVPILTGSFSAYMQFGLNPGDDPMLEAAIDALQQAARGKRTLVVAAGDLAHVGPAFDGPFPIDYLRFLSLEAADQKLMETINHNDAPGFYDMIAAEGNRRNICGVAPIYLTMRMLDSHARGRLIAYDRCPADAQNTSFVSICGMVFHEV
jgi:MEMO1 family protein